ncbi:MAG: hypothetical protein M1835_000078 [Candelina submexicana]|nr:MAG: hypothetical protein M1835_000078 [Candelina submexicana]
MGVQYSKYFVSQERVPYIAQPTEEPVPDASRVEPSTETSLVTARELRKQPTFNDSMKETLANLMRSVRAGKHNAAEHILRYIQTHSEASLYKGLLQSVCYHTSVLFSGLENGFEDLNLAALGSTISTKMQGVYAIVFRWKSGSWRIYIGSAFGVKGIAGRVNRRHKANTHRKLHSNIYLYRLIDHPDVDAYYMSLAKHESRKDDFGDTNRGGYNLYVNRSDPLSTDDHVALAKGVNKGIVPLTPSSKRLEANRRKYAVPDDGVLRNDEAGEPRAIKASGAGAVGYLGPAVAREDQDDDVAAEMNMTNNEKEVLMQQCKVFFFRIADLKPGDVRVLVDNNIWSTHLRFDKILVRTEKWRVSFQNSMWGSEWFVNFVNTNVKTSGSTGPGQLTAYKSFDKQRKLNFWLHWSRWNTETAMACYGPLRKAIDLNEALLNLKLSALIQGVYGVACITTWQNRCQFMDPTGHFSSNEEKGKVNVYQIYQDIRNVPEEYFPDRPSIQDVPTH